MSSTDDPFLEEPPGGVRPPSRSGHRFNPISSGERSRSSSISSSHPRRAAAHSGTPRSRAPATTDTEAHGQLYPSLTDTLAWSMDEAAAYVNTHLGESDSLLVAADGSVALFNVLERACKLDIFDTMSRAFAILEKDSHTWMTFRETSRLIRAAGIRNAQSARTSNTQDSDWATKTPRATRQGSRTRPVSPTSHFHTGHTGETQLPDDTPMTDNTFTGNGKEKDTASEGDNRIPPSILATIDLIAASIRSLYIQLDMLPGDTAKAARDVLHNSFAPSAPTGSFTFHNAPTNPPRPKKGETGSNSGFNTRFPLPERPRTNHTMPRTPPPPRNRGPPPAVNRATRLVQNRAPSYATVAKATPADFLRQAGSILAAAPSITPEEALAIAKTVPIVAKPTASKGKKAVVQGTKASLAVATTQTLLSERAVPSILAEIITDPLLKDLPKTEVTISMNCYSAILNGGTTLTDDQKSAFISCVARATSSEQDTITSRARGTHSVLKLDFIPARTIMGPTTVTMVEAALRSNATFRAQTLFEPIVLVPNRRNQAFVTACIKVVDDRAGHVANSLLKQSVLVCSEHREFQVWESKNTAKQCTQCQRWGHNHHTCKTRGAFCGVCGEAHTTSTHNIYCSQCLAAGDDPLNCIEHEHCINCGGEHQAISHECPWFKARSNANEMKALQEQKKTANAAARATRSATRRGPPSSLPQQRAQAPPRAPSPIVPTAQESDSEQEQEQGEAMNQDNVMAPNA